MDRKRLEAAALAAGISTTYINAHGKSQVIPDETRLRLLEAMHRSPAQKKADIPPLPPVLVFSRGTRKAVTPQGKDGFRWQLTTEQGREYHGEVEAGNAFILPARLPEGYHQLTISRSERRWASRLIIAPARCYEPSALRSGEKLWGACIQLYTLRSADNWGMGDFGDLKKMLSEVAVRGGAFVGLNPVHALYPANPESASPYSPSSRRWLNVLYIDVNAVEDFAVSVEAQRWWKLPGTQQALEAAREAEWVDYPAVTALKMAALRMAWKHFATRDADDNHKQEFGDFVARNGESLYWQAAFDALHANQIAKDETRWGWPAWPEAYRDTDSPEVKAFCEQHADEVAFFLWLQWLAYSQFAACWESCQQHGMPVGLYRDLAVGVAEGGAETWRDRELYCMKASVGAPPDILGPLGQNWGLPPMDPHVMQVRAYEPFIQMLRASMMNCGALRIDHVMALLRLWWIPWGETADKGAYVSYPVDDLLAILALESQRHQCMVIGEDLGTVPVEIISKLRRSGVYSYKVLWFERVQNNQFRAPEDFPEQSMAVATTHDLPTLRGYWESGDLALGKTLGLYPDEAVFRGLQRDREQAKQGLLDALHRAGCLAKRSGKKASQMKMTPVLNRGMQRYIADSNSALLGLQPEDWLDMSAPVNIPGTSDQYPNWRRKLTTSLEMMFADDGVNRLIKDLDKRRRLVKKAPKVKKHKRPH